MPGCRRLPVAAAVILAVAVAVPVQARRPARKGAPAGPSPVFLSLQGSGADVEVKVNGIPILSDTKERRSARQALRPITGFLRPGKNALLFTVKAARADAEAELRVVARTAERQLVSDLPALAQLRWTAAGKEGPPFEQRLEFDAHTVGTPLLFVEAEPVVLDAATVASAVAFFRDHVADAFLKRDPRRVALLNELATNEENRALGRPLARDAQLIAESKEELEGLFETIGAPGMQATLAAPAEIEATLLAEGKLLRLQGKGRPLIRVAAAKPDPREEIEWRLDTVTLVRLAGAWRYRGRM